MTDRESGEGRDEHEGHAEPERREPGDDERSEVPSPDEPTPTSEGLDQPEVQDDRDGHDRPEGDDAHEPPSVAESIAAAEAFESGTSEPDFGAGSSDAEPWTAPPEPPAPTPSPTPSESRDSMTDQESHRAEAEASAEAAFDDGRGTALPGDDDERDPALDLAALHLRLGSLALARSELETYAGRGVLDANARIDLAEVRWRTGDLVGGGEVAREALAGGGEAVVALIVAAEAASALGRPSEARRLAGRALSLNGGPIDSIFAGMPRSSVWPADPAEPVPSPSTLFPPERSDLPMESDRGDATAVGDDRVVDDIVRGTDAAREGEPGLWDLHEAAALAAGAALPVPSDLDPSALFDAGRAALENGDRASAAVHLGLVVRMAPALAPAVLSLLGEPGDSGLQLVQGDAYRAVGHETEARRSYAAAFASASTPPTSASVEWFEPPATTEHAAQAWWLESLDESIAPAAWPPATVQPPPEPAEPDAYSVAEPEMPAEPKPETSHEPETRAEPETPTETETPTEPETPTEAETLGVAPPEPDHEAESRDDEGRGRDDEDKWGSDR